MTDAIRSTSSGETGHGPSAARHARLRARALYAAEASNSGGATE
ncbi:hypothetical protein ACFPN0_30650 [Kitasatospora cinereorecta]